MQGYRKNTFFCVKDIISFLIYHAYNFQIGSLLAVPHLFCPSQLSMDCMVLPALTSNSSYPTSSVLKHT